MSEVIYSPQNKIPMIDDDLRWIVCTGKCPATFPTAEAHVPALTLSQPHFSDNLY